MSNPLFMSRREAREYAKKNNMVVVDRGLNVLKRWTVAPKKGMPTTKKAKEDPVGIMKPVHTLAQPIVLVTQDNIHITLLNGEQYTLNSSSPIFKEVGVILWTGGIDAAVQRILEEKEAEKKKTIDFGDNLVLIDNVLYWHGQKQESSIAKRIIKDIENDCFDERYVKFMQKLLHNPSYASVKMLYDFVKHNDLEILENGNIKAYKKIKITVDGPRDCHTGKVPNYKGQVISMPRNMVEDNPNRTCSQGLHVASIDYAATFEKTSRELVEVSVDPADIVSVPYDYNQKKCRCCRYEVMTGTPKPAGAPDIIVIGVQGKILEEIYLQESKED